MFNIQKIALTILILLKKIRNILHDFEFLYVGRQLRPDHLTQNTDAKIHLISCIGVDFDNEYIYHFINHYKKLEIDKYHFILQTNTDNTKQLENATFAIHKEIPKAQVVHWKEEFDPKEKARRINTIIQESLGDWHLVVDIDEFVTFEKNSIRITIEKYPNNIFFGKLIDRVAEDGKIKVLEPHKDIFLQFPKTVEYTKNIGGIEYKPILFQNQLLHKQLHKTNKYSYKQIYLGRFPVLKIHHFKWTSTSKEKLLHRQSEYKKRGYSWYIESERAIDRYF